LLPSFWITLLRAGKENDDDDYDDVGDTNASNYRLVLVNAQKSVELKYITTAAFHWAIAYVPPQTFHRLIYL
jgi:hypothetical protein